MIEVPAWAFWTILVLWSVERILDSYAGKLRDELRKIERARIEALEEELSRLAPDAD